MTNLNNKPWTVAQARVVAEFAQSEMDRRAHGTVWLTEAVFAAAAVEDHLNGHEGFKNAHADMQAAYDDLPHIPGLDAALQKVMEGEKQSGENAMNDIWKEYAADFNAMTDAQIDAETDDARSGLEAAESWLEAVASWQAAGRPRNEG